jgi:hypothetical protein
MCLCHLVRFVVIVPNDAPDEGVAPLDDLQSEHTPDGCNE